MQRTQLILKCFFMQPILTKNTYSKIVCTYFVQEQPFSILSRGGGAYGPFLSSRGPIKPRKNIDINKIFYCWTHNNLEYFYILCSLKGHTASIESGYFRTKGTLILKVGLKVDKKFQTSLNTFSFKIAKIYYHAGYIYIVAYTCTCIQVYIYVYTYVRLYITSIFYYTFNKDGGRFFFFSHRWRNLEDQKLKHCVLIKKKKERKLNCPAVEDGSSLQPLWNTSSSLNELFIFEESINPSLSPVFLSFQMDLLSPVVVIHPLSELWMWMFPWKCEEEKSFYPIMINSWIECWFDLQEKNEVFEDGITCWTCPGNWLKSGVFIYAAGGGKMFNSI